MTADPATPAALSALEGRLGYAFEDRALLVQALTHTTWSHERRDAGFSEPPHQQRLEFLGDAALGFALARLLFEAHPHQPEGHLSAYRAYLAKGASLSRLARELDLGPLVRLGVGARQQGLAGHPSVLEDTLEAILGAMVLDRGYSGVETLVDQLLGEVLRVERERSALKDPISRLQEHVQQEQARADRPVSLPVYRVVATTGPDHMRWFEVEVSVEGRALGRGIGPSKKKAKRFAALAALEELGLS